MATDLDLLMPAFKPQVVTLLARCKARGYEMRPYFSIRTPFDQARLWRQSRSKEEIDKKISEFQTAGASFLVKCLVSVGPQHGDFVTNAAPGFSWHQWGEAVDCFWLVDSKAEWSSKKLINGSNGYRVYVEEAARLSLTAGGNWNSLKDWPHVQFQKANSPETVMSVTEIDKIMKTRFGP